MAPISADFTLEAWIYARTGTQVMFIAGKRVSGLFGDKGFELLTLPAPGGFMVRWMIRAGGTAVEALSDVLSVGRWYHVAGVRKAATTNVNLYVDGALVRSVMDTIAGAALTGGQHFSVGGAIQGDGTFQVPFDGFIDEVRLSSGDLAFSQLLNKVALSFSQSGNQLTLLWTTDGYVVQVTDDLSNPAGWTDVSNGGTSPVTVNISAAQKFYRLRK